MKQMPVESRFACTGNAFTLADIACGVALGYLDFRHGQFDWRVLHANLAKLAAKLAERPSFAETAPQEAQAAALKAEH